MATGFSIQGALTAMVTPFRNGQVDWDRLKRNVEFQIQQGIDGLVPMGTTGESPTLSHEEHNKVVEVVVKTAAGRVKVIAGTGSNCTQEALGMTQHAREVGADAAMLVVPYYNKPTQEGMYRHFSTVADKVGIPIVLYNIPGRSGVALTPATVARLTRHAPIVAIKEATGSMDIASEILSLCSITVMSGDDSLTLPLMSVGGKGVISVLSNLIPARVKALTAAALAGDFAQARKLHIQLYPLCKGMFVETNPIPIKTAMAMAGMDSGELRLPMCELMPDNRAGLEKLLKQHQVI
jgi:4-hydroxy-tetrahydrodipicolinate synthase